MKKLIYFEKMKILKRKSTVFACLFMVLGILALCMIFMSDQAYFTADGAEARGLEAIRAEREMDRAVAGPLTAKRLKEILHKYQEVYGNADNYAERGGWLKEEVYCREILPYLGIIRLMQEVYSPAGTYDTEILLSVTDEMIDQFYETRRAKIRSKMNAGDNTDFYTDAEKAKAAALDGKVAEPFLYDYSGGWETLLIRGFQMIFLLAGLVICIVLSPIFAREYQMGTDAVILASRYGRRETVRAKMAAGVQAMSGIYLLAVITGFLSILAVFGIQGWNCNYQLLMVTSFYGLKIWQVVLLGMGLNYLVMLSVMALVMLLSAVCKTPFTAVIVSMLYTVTALFFPAGNVNGIGNKIVSLLPARAVDTHAVFSSYFFYSFGKVVITFPCMILIFTILMTVLCLPAAGRRFRIHQVV